MLCRYRSVVGPVVRGSGGGGAVLVSSRPRHAALPALVRDALARLPNGEGTRHHVLTLLRSVSVTQHHNIAVINVHYCSTKLCRNPITLCTI